MKVGWYKQSALFDNLLKTIVLHLRNSKNYANDTQILSAISQQTQGADDAMSLNAAINKASSIVANQQGGMLTQPQQQMLTALKNKIQDVSPMKPNAQQMNQPQSQQNQMQQNQQEQPVQDAQQEQP